MAHQFLVDLANMLKQASVEIRALSKRKEPEEELQEAAAVIINTMFGNYKSKYDPAGFVDEEDEVNAMLEHIQGVLQPMGIDELAFGSDDDPKQVVIKFPGKPDSENS